jgi:hypothetical protein
LEGGEIGVRTSDRFLAGFFDADGAVMIQRGGSRTTHYLLCVRVYQANPQILLLFRERFGGSVKGPYHRSDKRRPAFIWGADAKRAENFLKCVVKYLIVKRERAQKALAFRELFKGKNVLPRGNAVSTLKKVSSVKGTGVLLDRERMFSEMRVLNKRGA